MIRACKGKNCGRPVENGEWCGHCQGSKRVAWRNRVGYKHNKKPDPTVSCKCAACGMPLIDAREYHTLEYCERFKAGEPRSSIAPNPHLVSMARPYARSL